MDAEKHDTGDLQASDWAPTERISWFPVPDEEDLDPRVSELVAKQREKLGAPNNVVRTHAWRPELMHGARCGDNLVNLRCLSATLRRTVATLRASARNAPQALLA